MIRSFTQLRFGQVPWKIDLLVQEKQEVFLLRKEHTCVNNEQEIASVTPSDPGACHLAREKAGKGGRSSCGELSAHS